MLVWCLNSEVTIVSTNEPITQVLKPEPTDTKEQKEDKKSKPYINKRRVIFIVSYKDNEYIIPIKKNYRWNGTNCLGLQHLPCLLDASMVHDAICENHSLVNNNRQLSTIIFREIGIASGAWHWFMHVAYYVVDTYQKLFVKSWRV